MENRNNTFAVKKLSSLYILPVFVKEAGYQLEQAFYTAMSMDTAYWKTLLTLQAETKEKAAYAKADYRLCNELTHTWFMIETMSGAGSGFRRADSELTTGLLERVLYYSRKKGFLPADCFHAKMAFLRYSSASYPDRPYYRIGVFSKNLTHDGDFQNICVLDGFAGEKASDNGLRLKAYLDYCIENSSADADEPIAPPEDFISAMAAFDAITNIILPEGCDVFFNGLGAAGIRQENGGSCLWDVLMTQPQGLNLVTKSLFMDPDGKYWTDLAQPNGISVYNCLQKENDRWSDKTHMKLYWRKVSESNKINEFWAGSANFSAAALGRYADKTHTPYRRRTKTAQVYDPNIECLVRIQDEICGLPAALKATTPKHTIMTEPPAQRENPDDSRSVELTVLRQIRLAHQFSYEETKQGFRLLCQKKYGNPDDTDVESDALQEYVDASGNLWYWLAVPQSRFHNDSCAANFNQKPLPYKDVVVLSLWTKPEDGTEADGLKCCRWCYVCPEDLPKANLQKAGKRLQKQLFASIQNKPWIEKMLSAETDEQRQRVFDKWHVALGELEGLNPAARENYLPLMQTVQEFELRYRNRQVEHCVQILENLPISFEDEAEDYLLEIQQNAQEMLNAQSLAWDNFCGGNLQAAAMYLDTMDMHRLLVLEWLEFAEQEWQEDDASEDSYNG